MFKLVDPPPQAGFEMLERWFPEQMRCPMDASFVKDVLDKALPAASGNGQLPEPMFHDVYVTAWRTLDQAAYEALAHDKARHERDGDRYGLLVQIATVMRRDAREVLIAKLLEAVFGLIDDRVDSDARAIEAMNAVRLLYGWELRQRSGEAAR
jgi:hypothetical protein